MGKGTNKSASRSSSLSAEAFSTFTRERIREILKSCGSPVPDWAVTMAATCLASLDPHGPNPGSELISTAMDVLATAGSPAARDLLWQAASHAANWRIRLEAISRCGHATASTEERHTLRKWATEGFTGGAGFQNDQFSVDMAKAAAIHALGQLSDPDPEDIEILITALSLPPKNNEKLSARVFQAAADAYWEVGTPASLPKLVTLMSNGWGNDNAITIVALSAKFTAGQLKSHANEIHKALHHHAQQWQENPGRTARLVNLAEKLASTEFLRQWAASYGADGLDHGRGKLTAAMLKKLDHVSEGLAQCLLILVPFPARQFRVSDLGHAA